MPSYRTLVVVLKEPFVRKFASVMALLSLCLACSGIEATNSTAEAQSQRSRLPKAGFNSYSRNLRVGSGSSSSSGSGVGSNYNSGSGLMMRQTPGSPGIMSTPGLHVTRGESRTRQNYNQPYNPGEPKLNMQMVRWPREKMPLLVWISPGLELPKMPFDQLQATRVEQVYQMFKSQYPLEQLPVASGWTQKHNYIVAAGIEKWRVFQDEGLLSFGFTNNPYEAHVVVFFTDNFQGTSGPGGIIVGANTCAQLFTPAQLKDPNFRQKPVVIEFSLNVNHDPDRLLGASAHEFGHALGIKAHSPYREDIMYADRVVDDLSEGDKATLRMLYRSKTPYVM